MRNILKTKKEIQDSNKSNMVAVAFFKLPRKHFSDHLSNHAKINFYYLKTDHKSNILKRQVL